MKLKRAIGEIFNRLTKKYGTDEIPLSVLHHEVQAKGFEITEEELESYITNNPDVLTR